MITIRARIFLGIVLSLAAVLVLGGLLFWTQRSHARSLKGLEVQMEKLSEIDALQLAMTDAMIMGSSFLITGNAEYGKKFGDTERQVSHGFAGIAGRADVTDEERERLAEGEKSFSQAADIYNKLFSGEFDRQVLGVMMGEASFDNISTAIRVMDDLREGAKGMLDTAEDDALRLSRVLGGLVAAAVVVFLIGGIAFGMSIYRAITGPVTEILDAAGEISRGDLSRELSVERKDEVGRLAGAMEGMRRGLASLVRHVGESLSGVRGSSDRLMSVAEGVTKGSEGQVADSGDI